MIEKKSQIEAGWNPENSYSHLPKLFFSIIKQSPVANPELVILNEKLSSFLGLNIEGLRSREAISVLSGNKVPEGMLPLAQAYAGHQFGHFTMLGDGRAQLIFEHITPTGARLDIQLKGSGQTPYSRGGDGRAALGPMLREYIISEAMHYLGIETTRSLAVVLTGEPVIRETVQPGAILTRVAKSHIRVGTFQYVSKWGSVEDLKALADYTLQRHFPQIDLDQNRYISLLEEVIRLQAKLIAKWQLTGFIHGVMNTDNMAIGGETIDYGPCAFMDKYHPETVFSSIDIYGRYSYSNQPSIAVWNLSRFAETLLPLLNTNQTKSLELAKEAIADFDELYYGSWVAGMRAKLGIFDRQPEDKYIIENLLNIMQEQGFDYTNTFLSLTFEKEYDGVRICNGSFENWKKLWQDRLGRQKQTKEAAHKLMRDSNPALIPRNHRVEEAIDSAVNGGDYSVLHRFLDVLSSPYDHLCKQAEYSTLPELSSQPYRTFCGT
jgi:uncharacterized protein YdiU (UPF0061 family)